MMIGLRSYHIVDKNREPFYQNVDENQTLTPAVVGVSREIITASNTGCKGTPTTWSWSVDRLIRKFLFRLLVLPGTEGFENTFEYFDCAYNRFWRASSSVRISAVCCFVSCLLNFSGARVEISFRMILAPGFLVLAPGFDWQRKSSHTPVGKS